MLLFMTIPLMTPLNAGPMHMVMYLAGGILFSLGLGTVSNTILKKQDLIWTFRFMSLQSQSVLFRLVSYWITKLKHFRNKF